MIIFWVLDLVFVGFSRAIDIVDCLTLTHPHPSPPLEREGTFRGASTCVGSYVLKW